LADGRRSIAAVAREPTASQNRMSSINSFALAASPSRRSLSE
jgi:hypothetical protein